MARVEIPQSVIDSRGRPVSGAAVYVKDHATGIQVSVWDEEEDGELLEQPLTTFEGRITGWVEPGHLDIVCSYNGFSESVSVVIADPEAGAVDLSGYVTEAALATALEPYELPLLFRHTIFGEDAVEPEYVRFSDDFDVALDAGELQVALASAGGSRIVHSLYTPAEISLGTSFVSGQDDAITFTIAQEGWVDLWAHFGSIGGAGNQVTEIYVDGVQLLKNNDVAHQSSNGSGAYWTVLTQMTNMSSPTQSAPTLTPKGSGVAGTSFHAGSLGAPIPIYLAAGTHTITLRHRATVLSGVSPGKVKERRMWVVTYS